MNKELTIRNIGKGIGDFFNNAINFVLDFDLLPVVKFGFGILFIIGGASLILSSIKKDIAKWNTYHVGQKIMHPIWLVVAIFSYCLFFWLFFLA